MEKYERLCLAYEHLRSQGIVHTQKDVAGRMGSTPSNVSAAFSGKLLSDNYLKRFNIAFGNIFNLKWLINGEGDMLRQTDSTHISNSNIINGGTNTNVNMTISGHTETQVEEAEVIEGFETAPIIPSVWVKRHDFDIMRMTEEQWDNLEHSKVAISGTLIDAWYMMPDNSMAPLYLKGDKVGLALQPTKKIVPGCIYGIDTSTHGMLVRKLFEAENGYRAHAIDEQGFPDFFIAYDETFTLSRVIVLVRL